MGEGLRYNIQHMGDIFADSLERAFDCVTSSTRGVSLTYDMHELKKRTRKILSKIGERTAELRKRSPEQEVFADDKMVGLFSKLEDLEERIASCIREREQRLNPTGTVDPNESV